MKLRSAMILIAGFLCGCASTPAPTAVARCPAVDGSNNVLCFVEPEKAPAGQARLYIFRPDFSELNQQDRPLLTIDGSVEIRLPLRSYSYVDLGMGHHTYRLTPGAGDSTIWNLDGAFDISADGPFYLAVWNADVSTAKSPDYVEYGKDVAVATAIGVATAALTGGFAFFPVPTLHTAVDKTSEARMELITEDQALNFLRQCEVSPATRVTPDTADAPPVAPPPN